MVPDSEQTAHMTLEEIKELIQVVLDSGVAELEVTRGENKVRIQRTAPATSQQFVLPQQTSATSTPGAPPQSATVGAGATESQTAPAIDENIQYIESPIVGTYYEAPAPDAEPFVQVGDHVTPGQVLCIIESMKLMNEIEAEFAGTIVDKLVENGKPVEYGESLFSIRPD